MITGLIYSFANRKVIVYHLVCWQSWLVTAILIEFLSLSLLINCLIFSDQRLRQRCPHYLIKSPSSPSLPSSWYAWTCTKVWDTPQWSSWSSGSSTPSSPSSSWRSLVRYGASSGMSSLSLFSLSLRYLCLQVLGQRRRLRSRGLGHAEEQQALPAARSLHLHLQCHRRDYQRDHQLCDISYFLVSG